MKSKKVLILAIIFTLLTSIFAMSDDGANEPIEIKKEVNKQQSKQSTETEKSDPANFKFETENITVVRDEKGNALDEKGKYLVPVDRIVKDKDGKESVLDFKLRTTGLSIEEFTKHKLEYSNRVLGIERKKGFKIFSRHTIGWYDNRVNLDKLEELQEAGFDVFRDDKKGLGNNFEGVAFTKEAVIIGEIIESENIDINTTGFYTKFKIRVDEIIKDSEFVTKGQVIEVGFDNGISNYKQVSFEKKGVILLLKTLRSRNDKNYPIMFSKFWEINEDKIIGYPRHPITEESMVLNEFRKRVNKLILINDADNFYKRSWKEVKK